MSYDLYFYKRRNGDLTEEQVANYLNNNITFNVSEHSKQWHYSNKETGVYFLIDWNEKNIEKEDIEIFDSFQEFEYLNFSISINFFRPRYFGLEIFPLVEKVIRDLDLFILNPQDVNVPDSPIKFSDGYLQEQWISHNDEVSRSQFKELNFEYFPVEKSNYMWRYLLNRKEIEEKLTEDIFVPGYFIIKSNDDGQLYTACVWPKNIPIILPPVDYIIIQKEYKKFFRTIEESGLVSYSNIMEKFKNSFEDYKNDIPNLKILKRKQADQIVKEFNAIKISKTIEDFGKGISKDGFVNVRP